ncbi:hypothetical protein UXP39_14870 [Enterobacter sichuanensis]|jgi:hypothetical protein|uniref:hypothetical protein n=1 Tax=Enterobacter sichuanensis TaxID=2071710 RepID=UPI002FD433EE
MMIGAMGDFFRIAESEDGRVTDEMSKLILMISANPLKEITIVLKTRPVPT